MSDVVLNVPLSAAKAVRKHVREERARQVVKHGSEVVRRNEHRWFSEYLACRLAILTEEFLEVVRGVNDMDPLGDIYDELIQVAATAQAIAEGVLAEVEDD